MGGEWVVAGVPGRGSGVQRGLPVSGSPNGGQTSGVRDAGVARVGGRVIREVLAHALNPIAEIAVAGVGRELLPLVELVGVVGRVVLPGLERVDYVVDVGGRRPVSGHSGRLPA